MLFKLKSMLKIRNYHFLSKKIIARILFHKIKKNFISIFKKFFTFIESKEILKKFIMSSILNKSVFILAMILIQQISAEILSRNTVSFSTKYIFCEQTVILFY